MTLKNKQTGLVIDADNIASQDDSGIVVTNKECWKFIPSENVEEIEEYEDGTYYNEESIPEYLDVPVTPPFHNTENTIEDNYTEKARYRFGIKDLGFYNKAYDKVSAIYSNLIDVSKADYITVTAKMEECYNSVIEFSVIDGTIEEYILPEGINIIEKEKLFLGVRTRFVVDSSETKPQLYEDGILCARDYSSLTYNDFEKHEYTLTYVPLNPTYKYSPENDSIRIKIIIRNYTDTFSPVVLTGLTINKYGETPEWI